MEQTNSAYAIAKIAGIELVKAYRTEFGLKWISLMPTNIYGPGDNFSLETGHVLPALIRKFVEARNNNLKELILWGTGNPMREFLYSDDLASAIIFTFNKYEDSAHLNIGTGQEVSILDLANIIAKKTGYNGLIKWDPAMPDGTPRKLLDSSKIRNLGWQPNVSLEEGIEKTITWYENNLNSGLVRL